MRALLLIIFSVGILQISAQKVSIAPVVKCGVSWFDDHFYSSDAAIFTNKALPTYSLGIELNARLLKHSGVILQVEIERRGANSSQYLLDPDFFTYDKVTLHYLNVPVKIYRTIFDRISLELGADFGVLILKNIEERQTYNYDVGLTAGLEYSIKKLNIGIEYYYGMLPFFNVVQVQYTSSGGYTASKYELYNQSLMLSLSYKLFSKKQK